MWWRLVMMGAVVCVRASDLAATNAPPDTLGLVQALWKGPAKQQQQLLSTNVLVDKMDTPAKKKAKPAAAAATAGKTTDDGRPPKVVIKSYSKTDTKRKKGLSKLEKVAEERKFNAEAAKPFPRTGPHVKGPVKPKITRTNPKFKKSPTVSSVDTTKSGTSRTDPQAAAAHTANEVKLAKATSPIPTDALQPDGEAMSPTTATADFSPKEEKTSMATTKTTKKDTTKSDVTPVLEMAKESLKQKLEAVSQRHTKMIEMAKTSLSEKLDKTMETSTTSLSEKVQKASVLSAIPNTKVLGGTMLLSADPDESPPATTTTSTTLEVYSDLTCKGEMLGTSVVENVDKCKSIVGSPLNPHIGSYRLTCDSEEGSIEGQVWQHPCVDRHTGLEVKTAGQIGACVVMGEKAIKFAQCVKSAASSTVPSVCVALLMSMWATWRAW